MEERQIIKTEDLIFDYTVFDENGDETGKSRVLSDINLSIKEGSFVAVLGHNGSGKSTLAKHFNGILIPSSGKVLVDGIDTSDESRIYDIRQTVGMVFQNPDNQIVATIVEEDVAFALENLGVPPAEIRERVDEALKLVNMYEYRTGTPFKLSGGQKQRVAVAAVLAMRPSVLILDESTSMLDPEGREEILSSTNKLNKEKSITVILITHYMDEALRADRICVISGGKHVGLGTPQEIFGQPEVLKAHKLDLPVAGSASLALRERGIPVKPCLTDEELAEELCRLK